MPFESEVGERGLLGARFLHVVLAEGRLAERGELAQCRSRLGLADCEQAGGCAVPGGGAGFRDPFQYGTVG